MWKWVFYIKVVVCLWSMQGDRGSQAGLLALFNTIVEEDSGWVCAVRGAEAGGHCCLGLTAMLLTWLPSHSSSSLQSWWATDLLFQAFSPQFTSTWLSLDQCSISKSFLTVPPGAPNTVLYKRMGQDPAGAMLKCKDNTHCNTGCKTGYIVQSAIC